MDEWTIKTPNPICRLFFKIDLLRLCGIVFNRFYRLEIHLLLVGIFNPACERTILVYCCPSTFSLTSPLPKLNIQYKQTMWVWGRMLNCAVDHILHKFYTLFLTRFRTNKIASPPQIKMTSKDDLQGLVSLKFLRPWCSCIGRKAGADFYCK